MSSSRCRVVGEVSRRYIGGSGRIRWLASSSYRREREVPRRSRAPVWALALSTSLVLAREVLADEDKVDRPWLREIRAVFERTFTPREIEANELPDEDEQTIEDRGSHSVYGYVPFASGEILLTDVLALAHDDVFFDLGSGCGALVAQAALLHGVTRAVGVELASKRHALACECLDELAYNAHATQAGGPSWQQRVQLVHGDLLEADVSDATAVWIAGLCFPPQLMEAIAHKLEHEAPHLRVVATLRAFPPEALRSLHLREERFIPMSWTDEGARGTRVFVYRRRSLDE